MSLKPQVLCSPACNSNSITIIVIFITAYKSLNSHTPALPHYTQCKRLIDYVVTRDAQNG